MSTLRLLAFPISLPLRSIPWPWRASPSGFEPRLRRRRRLPGWPTAFVAPALDQARQQDAALIDGLDHPAIADDPARWSRAISHPAACRHAAPVPPHASLRRRDHRWPIPTIPPRQPHHPARPVAGSSARAAGAANAGAEVASPRCRMSRRRISTSPAPLRAAPAPQPALARGAAAWGRLQASLTPEMLKNFDLFLYVSKAKQGPLAQRMYVFRRAQGELMLLYDWAASTGREQYEICPWGVHTRTDTPAGFYELDPDRMYRAYHSYAWDQAMPYAMFFNWEHRASRRDWRFMPPPATTSPGWAAAPAPAACICRPKMPRRCMK